VINGLFRIYYALRNPITGPGSPIHGVQGFSVVIDFARALKYGYARLTGKAFGWPGLSHLPVPVRVYYLKAAFGFALPRMLGSVATLSFNSRETDVRIQEAKRGRQATAIHELTHLLQFEYGPPATWRWFNEATATAMEGAVYKRNQDCFRYLWEWVTQPHRSLDSLEGYTASPLIAYLMRRYGLRIASDIYRRGLLPSTKLRPFDAVAQALPSGVAFASKEGYDMFGSGYCCEAYFIGDPSGRFGDSILRRFGERAVSESFGDYPVEDAASGHSIDHLACRYYRFRPVEGKSRLTVTVALTNEKAKDFLRGELIGVTPHILPAGPPVTLKRNGDSMTAELTGFQEVSFDHAVLVVANCAYGAGSANADGLTYTISAQLH